MVRLLFIFCVLPVLAFAQTLKPAHNVLGTWNIYHVKLELSKKWSLFFEPQLRSLSFYKEFHYYEFKTGASFRLDKNFGFTLGLGDYNTFQAGGDFVTPHVSKETRTWAQVNMYNFLERLKIEHRYRAEQRFGINQFTNRFRYRISLTLPIVKHKVESRTFYLNVSNEIFFTDTPPFFQRNRFFWGIGYEFTPLVALQMGLMHQFDYKINDETGRNFLQISLLMNLKWQHEERETVPTNEN